MKNRSRAPVDWDQILNLRAARDALEVSQAQLATMLGVSIRTVQSCEQGWRKPSPNLEKMLLLVLLAHRHGAALNKKKCWLSERCSPEQRKHCVAYVSRQGHLCWLMLGNVCRGKQAADWEAKKAICGECSFLAELLRAPAAKKLSARPGR